MVSLNDRHPSFSRQRSARSRRAGYALTAIKSAQNIYEDLMPVIRPMLYAAETTYWRLANELKRADESYSQFANSLMRSTRDRYAFCLEAAYSFFVMSMVAKVFMTDTVKSRHSNLARYMEEETIPWDVWTAGYGSLGWHKYKRSGRRMEDFLHFRDM